MTTYRPESVDTVARYQAKKLVKGGDAAFAGACGEYARNDALRSLNETIISNVGRDKDHGVRFARVPTGFETCAFCIMLASRSTTRASPPASSSTSTGGATARSFPASRATRWPCSSRVMTRETN